MPQPTWTPPFVGILVTDKDGKNGENIVLWYEADDHRKYRIELTPNAVGRMIDALQNTSDSMTAGKVRSLKVLAHTPAATPDLKSILIRTQEWGTIALEMPQEALVKL